jgi:hypothetical protein
MSTCAVLFTLITRAALAQGGGGGAAVVQGVYVDPDGVLRTVVAGDKSDRLSKLRKAARAPRAGGDVAAKSPLRKVSLTRLARQVAALAQAGKPVRDDMRFLAGIQQIQHVFVYPAEQDVVIAGPAEGWDFDPVGRPLGASSKRPAVWLDDLVVAMRIFPPDGDPNTAVGCSINHTQEGLRRLNEYMASLGRSIDRRQVNAQLIEGVRQALGLQDVALFGVAADTRLAMTLVEADYRMKLIGIGLEDPRVKGMVSYVSLLGPGSGGHNKLQRWWFVADYDAIVQSAEADAFEFTGQRVKLLSADDAVKVTGEVERKESADPINKRFAVTFTKHYRDLAAKSPIFAELQNAFDLIVLAALLEQREAYAQAPDLSLLLESQSYSPDPMPTPRLVESVVTAKWIGSKLAMPVGGGVTIEPSSVIRTHAGKPADAEKLREQRTNARAVAAERWWWD